MPVNPRPFLQDLYVPTPCAPHAAPNAHRTRDTCHPYHTALRRVKLTRCPFCRRVNKDIFVRLKWNETEYKGRL